MDTFKRGQGWQTRAQQNMATSSSSHEQAVVKHDDASGCMLDAMAEQIRGLEQIATTYRKLLQETDVHLADARRQLQACCPHEDVKEERDSDCHNSAAVYTCRRCGSCALMRTLLQHHPAALHGGLRGGGCNKQSQQ
jgi:hypothetical protein